MTLRTRFFAMTYDRQMAKTEQAGLGAFRESLLAGAAGQVLEIGGGTGTNLPFYGPAVDSLTMTEPQPPMLRRLQRRAREHARPPRSCARLRRTCPSMNTRSTRRSPRWSCAGSTISPGRCGSCGGCCDPAAGCSSSSTCDPATRVRPDRKTG